VEAQECFRIKSKESVGHKSLDTTLKYSRSMTEGKQEEILTNVLPAPGNGKIT
jgi:hypothetical protein